MGKFKAYLGTTEIEINKEKLELDVRLWDKAQITETQSKVSDSQVRVQKLLEIVEKIIQRSYLKPYHFEVDERGKILIDKPYEESEFKNPDEWKKYKQEMKEIHAFVDKKLDHILLELGIVWGWFTREEIKSSFRARGEPNKRGEET